ncbi:MAG: DNA sulfur modification protein DndE [Desulfobulbus sp.]|nr:DNA sulfur modification protein DndE [Desulfobulbus sp.]
MKPPIEHVRVSSKGKEVLLKIKRYTGLEHWNEICRVAFFRSLANQTPPSRHANVTDSTIDMDWKTFTGPYHLEMTSLIMYKAAMDGIDLAKKEEIAEYIRNHLERGISSMHAIKSLADIVDK